MKNIFYSYGEKLKVIYYPFVLIYISFVITYSFLNWFLVIEKGLIKVDETIIMLWLPAILSYIPIFIFLRPRILLLNFKKKDNHTFYQFLAWAAIIVTTLFSQMYLSTLTGKLTQLDSIDLINQTQTTKYYMLNHYYFDKASAQVLSTSNSGGRNNQNLNFNNFYVIPIYKDSLSSLSTPCIAWLGITKSKTVPNWLSDIEKTDSFNVFKVSSQKEFQLQNLNQFVYLEYLSNSDYLYYFKEAINLSEKKSYSEPIVFEAIDEPFECRYLEFKTLILQTFIVSNIVWLITLLFHSFNPSKLRQYKKGILRNPTSDLYSILIVFKLQKNYIITPIIAIFNILIYLGMVIYSVIASPLDIQNLLNWGGNCRPPVMEGEWWRLLTNMFLHGSFIHIFSNLIAFIPVGMILEPILGTYRFLIVYLIMGLLASVTSIYWHSNILSIGASGAIMGLYGIFLSLLMTNVYSKDIKTHFLLGTSVFVAYSLIMGLLGGIDNAAHIGGLISGFIVGFILYLFFIPLYNDKKS